MATVVCSSCGWWKRVPLRVLCMAHGALHLVEKHWGDYTAEVNVTRDRR